MSKTFASTALVLMSCLCLAAEPATTPAPLVGRWQILSMGARKVPDKFAAIWAIDATKIIVTLNGEVTTTSTYTTKAVDGHPTIYITAEGDKTPTRFGWYEFKGDELHMLIKLADQKPPTSWSDGEVMVLKKATP